MTWRTTLATAFAALCLAGAASAHTRSESFSVWEISGGQVRLTFTLPDVEAARLASPGEGAPSDATLDGYLGQHVSVTQAGKACDRIGDALPLSANKGFRRAEFQFECSGKGALGLGSTVLVDRVPSHVDYARVRNGNGGFIEQLITADHPAIEVAPAGAHDELQDASVFEYSGLGILHILTGPDHIAFLLGLVLISRRWRDLAFVITGFTLGHSLTLALAVTGLFRPQAAFIDAMIALTIGLIGAENIAVAARRPGLVAGGVGALLLAMAAARLDGIGALPVGLLLGVGLFAVCYLLASARLKDAAGLRALVTLSFGLIHGFAFANDLIEMNLPLGRLAQLLVAFNVGVELGQLAIVALMLGAAALLVRWRLAWPRAAVVDLMSSFLVGLGTFWLITRTYA